MIQGSGHGTAVARVLLRADVVVVLQKLKILGDRDHDGRAENDRRQEIHQETNLAEARKGTKGQVERDQRTAQECDKVQDRGICDIRAEDRHERHRQDTES